MSENKSGHTPITNAHINHVVAKAKKEQQQQQIKDTGERGLYLRISPQGKRVWYSVTKDTAGKPKWNRLGEYPAIGLSAAREAHRTVREQVRAGNNPVDARREQQRQTAIKAAQAELDKVRQDTETLMALLDAYKKTAATKSYKKCEKQVKLVFAELLNKPVSELTRQEINKAAHDYHAKAAANLAVGLLRPAIKWGAELYAWVPEGLTLIRNPHPPAKRAEKLTPAMVKALLPVFRAHKGHGECMWFMLHVGCRLGEAVNATWAQIDMVNGIWTIPGHTRKNTKNKNKYPDLVINLPKQVMAFLGGLERKLGCDYVFTLGKTKLGNWDRATKALQDTAGVFGFHRHDFRHFFSTSLANLGVSDAVKSAALGHLKGGLEGIYDHSTRADERKDALQKMADYLEKLARDNGK